MIAVLLLFAVLSGVHYFPETPLEEAILDKAMTCSRINPSSWPDGAPPRVYLRRILRIESQAGIPQEMRGFLLAMACRESGYNPDSEGDHKFSAAGRPKAIGLFQQWPWMEQEKYGYAIDRRNPYQATDAQARHWVSQVSKTKKHCGGKDLERLWAVAQVRSVRRGAIHCIRKKLVEQGHGPLSLVDAMQMRSELPKNDRARCQRCFERSRHYRIFKRWRKTWKHLLGPA